MKKIIVLLSTLFLVCFLSAIALAQESNVFQDEGSSWLPGEDTPEVKPSSPDTYGTSSNVTVTKYAHDFNLYMGTEATMNMTTSGRKCSIGTCGWLAGVNLPSGALIQGIEVSACDGDAAQQVQFGFYASPRIPSAPVPIIGSTGTGASATPGCSTFPVNLVTPVTVDNNAYAYTPIVMVPPGTNLEFDQFRVFYTLQVSPAPATATFSDVPTSHMFFQYIEALAAAGITTGYPDGTYGPDNYVTRGQMAVFLSRGFGLHWPN